MSQASDDAVASDQRTSTAARVKALDETVHAGLRDAVGRLDTVIEKIEAGLGSVDPSDQKETTEQLVSLKLARRTFARLERTADRRCKQFIAHLSKEGGGSRG